MEPCSAVPKSKEKIGGRGRGGRGWSIKLLNFFGNDKIGSWLSPIYLSFVLSDFHLLCHLEVYLTHRCMGQVRPHLILSCVACYFSSQDSLVSALEQNCIGFFYMKLVYFWWANWVFCYYLYLWKLTYLDFWIFLRQTPNKLFQCINSSKNWDVNPHFLPCKFLSYFSVWWPWPTCY